jgi:predicted Rossmann fold flavoprotein
MVQVTPVGPATLPIEVDAAIVGAGAAGIATAIFTLQRRPGLRLALLDGARRPGAKILVSGGTRCNVTNTVVRESDFNGGRPAVIRTILRAFPVAETVAFFQDIGVPVHEEADGKLFPDSNRSRDVLDALLNELARLDSRVMSDHRVQDVGAEAGGFLISTTRGPIRAATVVLATGGLSLPKTGSDGAGFELARRFGHTVVPTTPALAPLLCKPGNAAMHATLSGVSQNVRLELRVEGRAETRTSGAMLWTHFGVSGPVVLDMSRHWLRSRLNGNQPELHASLCPDDTFDTLEARWIALARRQPRISIQTAVATMLPSGLGAVLLDVLSLSAVQTLADLTRETRRRLVHAMLDLPLAVIDSRGYNYAEVTAGGVDLAEIDPSTMESRRRPGLYLVGEILDVDGRIGGFNFQWAWSTARVAARALARDVGRGL